MIGSSYLLTLKSGRENHFHTEVFLGDFQFMARSKVGQQPILLYCHDTKAPFWIAKSSEHLWIV